MCKEQVKFTMRCVVDKSTANSRTFGAIGTIGASNLPLSEAQGDGKGHFCACADRVCRNSQLQLPPQGGNLTG